MFQALEEVAQFGIGVEGQRVLALRTVQRDRADAAFDHPQKVLGAIAGQRPSVAGQQRGVGAHRGLGLQVVVLRRHLQAQLAEQREELLALGLADAAEEFDHPALVFAGDGLESLAALGCQAQPPGAAVTGFGVALHQAFFFKLVGQPGDVPAGDHQEARQRAHAQAVGVAVQLRQVIEARQRHAEHRTQALADLRFDVGACRPAGAATDAANGGRRWTGALPARCSGRRAAA